MKSCQQAAFFLMEPEQFNHLARSRKPENEAFFKKLKKQKLRNLDDVFQEQHHAVFEKTNCLTCANCCKTTSPIFYPRDIDRAAKALRMRPGDFMDKYLKVDEDKDYVLKQSPCAFLDSENYCLIYNDRPTACREYPHTDRKKIQQLLDLTFKNTMVCPAVLEITERLKDVLK